MFVCYVFVAFEPCFSFSATFELAILLASCNALLHWFSTRHGASDLVRNFFSFISFVLSPLVIAMQVFGGIILAIAYRGCIFSSYLRFDPIWLRVLRCFFLLLVWGWGNTLLCFISFPRFVFCGGKNAGFPSNPTIGRVICFFGRWVSSLKAQIALMMRKCNLMFV